MRTLTALAIAAALALPAGACAETATSEREAAVLADEVMKALGGRERWDRARGLRWSFGSEVADTVRGTRRHAWDKHTGWHRVEGMRRGVPFVLIHNLHTGEGRAWMDGQAIAGDSLAKLLADAKAMWTNDTYWMLMPYKLRDPGVNLAMAPDTTLNGRRYRRIALSFDKVGLTPGDRYWVWINDANRVERWEMLLEGDAPPPRTTTWEGWVERDGLWFPTAHRNGNRNTFTRDVEVVSAFPAGTFEAP